MAANMTPLQIAFLPYAPLLHETQLGDVRFYPIKPGQRNVLYKHIKDRAIREHIKAFFRQHQTIGKFEIENIALATVGDLNLRVLNDEEMAKLEIAKHILTFACIDRNRYFDWCTSDNFEIIYQSFIPGNMSIAPVSGAIHSMMDGGWEIKDIVFSKPHWIKIPSYVDYDKDLLSAFERCLTDKDDLQNQRILRSLGWYYNAYKNTHDISQFSRILMMATAFETLLGLGNEKRRKFRSKIHKLLGEDSELSIPITVPTKDGGKTTELWSAKQVWADCFYKLRSAIVHGDSIKHEQINYNNRGHFFIADRFYRECVKRILENKKYYGKYIPAFGVHMAPYSAISTPKKLNEYLLNQEP